MLAFVDQRFAIDQSPTDTDRFFDEAFLIAGQVWHHFRITFADRRWLEDRQYHPSNEALAGP